MRPEGFPRRLRIRRRGEFLRVQRGGHKHHVAHFLVFVKPTSGTTVVARPQPATRIGVTVTRKVGHAVVRNRIKRWVREAFRRHRHAFAPGFDMVWVAKRSAPEAGYQAVVEDMDALQRRLARRSAGAGR